jgi:hypothetical protein
MKDEGAKTYTSALSIDLDQIVTVHIAAGKVRFGSKADMCSAQADVR